MSPTFRTLLLIMGIVVFLISGSLILRDTQIWPYNNNSTTSDTQSFSLAPVNTVILEAPYKLRIIQGDSSSITITGSASRVHNTEVLQNGTMLTLRDNTNYRWFRMGMMTDWNTSKPEATLTVPSLQKVEVDGAGTVEFDSVTTSPNLQLTIQGAGIINATGIRSQSVRVDINGAGMLKLAGTTESCNYDIAGAGTLRTTDLTCNAAEAHVTGAGSIRLRAAATLNATISGAGSIEYYGSPIVEKTISGLGSIKKAGD